jgi:hypothetical protein
VAADLDRRHGFLASVSYRNSCRVASTIEEPYQ